MGKNSFMALEAAIAKQQKQIEELLRERGNMIGMLADQRKRSDSLDLDNSRLHRQLRDKAERIYELEQERTDTATRIGAVANLLIALVPKPPKLLSPFETALNL